MIKFENRFDEYAYRVASRKIDPAITDLKEGQWVTIDDTGKVVIADGTKKAFMSIGSIRDGRDTVTVSGKAQYLMGCFEVTTDQFDGAGTYHAMTPLKVKAGGVLTPWVTGTDKVELIEAYALGVPADGFIRIAIV